MLLKEGKGCNKDLYQSLRFLRLACANGYGNVTEVLNDMVNHFIKSNVHEWLNKEFTMDIFDNTIYNELSCDDKERLLNWLNDKLNISVGRTLEDFLTKEQVEICGKLLLCDPETVQHESDRLRIDETYEYRNLKKHNPAINDFIVKHEILLDKWFLLYVPFDTVLENNEYDNLKNKILNGEIDISEVK
jgi:hypothetical protein